MKKQPSFGPWEFTIGLLSVFVLAVLMLEQVIEFAEPVQQLLTGLDYLVCLFFLVDFGLSLSRAESKWRYLYTWGWLDLVSSLPALPWLRWGRAARLVRLLRLLRGIRASRNLTKLVLEWRAKSIFAAAASLSMLAVFVAAIGVLNAESGGDGSIASASDALWWALTTVTTVGYGDTFPKTDVGRIVAAALMVVGGGLFGVFAGYVASAFSSKQDDEQSAELSEIKIELQLLRSMLENSGLGVSVAETDCDNKEDAV